MSATDSPAADPARVPAEVVDALRGATRIALIGHVTPDADALASMYALALALPELGKYPQVVLPAGSVSRKLQYVESLAGVEAATPAALAECDLVVALDTAKEKRLNVGGELPDAPILNIDHHATNTQFGKWNWIVGTASSTSELVHALLRALDCQITPTIATLLYAGVHTDTQGFALGNTGPNSLAVGHDLARAGAEIPQICERMHRSHSRGEFELLRVIYANTQVGANGKLAWSTADHAEITAAGCTAADIDDQVEVPRSIEGIAVAILFSEGKAGKIRMNFRGEGGVSALELAQKFNGGGHHAAAGAILDGTMDEVTAKVLPVAEAYVASLVAPAS